MTGQPISIPYWSLHPGVLAKHMVHLLVLFPLVSFPEIAAILLLFQATKV